MLNWATVNNIMDYIPILELQEKIDILCQLGNVEKENTNYKYIYDRIYNTDLIIEMDYYPHILAQCSKYLRHNNIYNYILIMPPNEPSKNIYHVSLNNTYGHIIRCHFNDLCEKVNSYTSIFASTKDLNDDFFFKIKIFQNIGNYLKNMRAIRDEMENKYCGYSCTNLVLCTGYDE